jgi:phage gpG-like protein
MKPINAAKLAKIMRDMSKMPSRVSATIASDLSKEVQRNFDRGVDPSGKPWRKLAKSTLKRGRRPPPLTDTRKGRRSVKVAAMPGAGIRFTVGVLYMIYHLLGGPKSEKFPAGQPPKRSFLPLGTQVPATWLKIITKRFDQAAFKTWRRV